MLKKLYLFPLLGSAYLSGMSGLVAMEEQDKSPHMKVTTSPSLKPESKLEKQSLTLLPLEKGSLEETIGEIGQYFEQSIGYSQKTLNLINDIYNLNKSKKKAQARAVFNELYGQKIAPADDMAFLKDIMRVKKIYEVVIYNATTFHRDLFETLDGEFKYPRTAVGAALISAAAVLEENENKKSKAYDDVEALGSPLAEHLSRLHNDEIMFYQYIERLIYPYWIKEHEKDAEIFGQKVREQNNTYKVKNDTALRQAEELKQTEKKEATKKKHSKTKKSNKKAKNAPREKAKKAPRVQGGSKSSIIVPTLQVSKRTVPVSDKGVNSEKEDAAMSPVTSKSSIIVPTLQVSKLTVPVSDKRVDSEKEDAAMSPVTPALELKQEAIERESEKVLESENSLGKKVETFISFEGWQINETSPMFKGDKKQKSNVLVSKPSVPAFDISSISSKYRGLLNNIFSGEKNFEKIAWNDVKSMMQNAFNGKMYGVTGGSKRQFAVFLREQRGEPAKFVTVDDYNNYLKDCRKNKKFDYTIARKVVHTEKPHSRGASTKGKTRFMYPTLVELFASSLEKIGLTPQNLGW